jgi:hypothetical protein
VTVPKIPFSRFVLPSFALPPSGSNVRRRSQLPPAEANEPAGVNDNEQPEEAEDDNEAIENGGGLANALPPISDAVSVTRTFCGALFLPSVAAFLGSALFSKVPSRLHRTLLGGVTFIAVKGALKIYHKQHVYIRQCQRVIVDYDLPR